MTITLDRPDVINKTAHGGAKIIPKWLLLVLYQEQMDEEQLKKILAKVLPIGEAGAQRAVDDIKKNNRAVVHRGAKEIIEHYYELLKSNNVSVRMVQE